MLVGIPTVVDNPYFHDCLNAVRGQDVVVVKNGPVSNIPDWVTVHDPKENLGVAASWNYICQYAWDHEYPGVLILNDDFVLKSDFQFLELLDPAKMYRIEGYAAFYLTNHVWNTVGPFDEGYWPAYYEDCDHGQRLNIKGVEGIDINATDTPIQFEHAGVSWQSNLVTPYGRGGSSTSIKQGGELQLIHEIALNFNRDRFVQKWGGMPGFANRDIPRYVAPTKFLAFGSIVRYHDIILMSYKDSLVVGSNVDPYETAMAVDLLREGDRVLVAGGGHGSTSVALALKVGAQNVSTLEIASEAIQYMNQHIRIKNEIPFPVHHYGLWNETVHGVFREGKFYPNDTNGEAVTAISTNDILASSKSNALVLDVEGAEYAILPTLNLQALRVLVVEFHYGDPWPLIDKIRESGMEIAWKNNYTDQVFVIGAVRPT